MNRIFGSCALHEKTLPGWIYRIFKHAAQIPEEMSFPGSRLAAEQVTARLRRGKHRELLQNYA